MMVRYVISGVVAWMRRIEAAGRRSWYFWVYFEIRRGVAPPIQVQMIMREGGGLEALVEGVGGVEEDALGVFVGGGESGS